MRTEESLEHKKGKEINDNINKHIVPSGYNFYNRIFKDETLILWQWKEYHHPIK